MLGYNRWLLLKGLTAVLSIAGVTWLVLAYFIPAPPSTITIAVGIKGGPFEDIAHRYRERLARDRITLDVRVTDGAFDNLRLIKDRSSGVDVAFLFGGMTNSKQSPELISLGRIQFAPLWFFYHGAETLERLSQLKGKRITVGPGLRPVTNQILAPHGVNSESATVLPLAGSAAAKALKDGEVDVIYLPFELKSPIVQSLLRDPTVRLMSVTQAEAITRVHPFLAQLVLPQGVIDFERNIPANDVSLLALTNNVVVRNDLHPELVYLLAQTLSEEHGAAGIFQRAGDFPTATDPEFPVAQNALDFYKNGPSLLDRYLPFWITNYTKRIIALMATVIVIILPLFSYAPKLYRGLVEVRLSTMYRRLRTIEASLLKEVTISEISVLETELERLDRAIHSLSIPMHHSDLFFSIKSHLDVVRTRLRLRHVELRSQMTKTA